MNPSFVMLHFAFGAFVILIVFICAACGALRPHYRFYSMPSLAILEGGIVRLFHCFLFAT